MTTEESLRQQIWLGLLDSERATRYYRAAGDKYRRSYHWTAVTIALGSILTGASTLTAKLTDAGAAEAATVVFSIVTALAVAWLLRRNDARTLAQTQSASAYFAVMYREWRHVWDNRDDPNDASNVRVLAERMHAGPPVDMEDDEALNQACYEQAIQVVQHDFAYAP